MPNDKILERIRKLMALADPTKNDSQSQVEAAMEKVAELLVKHNLTEREVTEAEIKSAMSHERVWVNYRTDDGALLADQYNEWLVLLVRHVAYANYCHYLVSPRGGTFIGKAQNVEIAQYMFDSLVNRLLALSKQETKAYEAVYYQEHGDTAYKSYGGEHPKVWRRTWLEGAVSGVGEKLCKPRRDEELARWERDRKATKALIELNDNAIQAYMDEQFPWLKKKKPLASGQVKTANGTWSAYESGRAVGRNLSVNKGMDAGDPVRRLKDGR